MWSALPAAAPNPLGKKAIRKRESDTIYTAALLYPSYNDNSNLEKSITKREIHITSSPPPPEMDDRKVAETSSGPISMGR